MEIKNLTKDVKEALDELVLALQKKVLIADESAIKIHKEDEVYEYQKGCLEAIEKINHVFNENYICSLRDLEEKIWEKPAKYRE